MRLFLASSLLLVCSAGLAQADVVTLKNGDRVTGTLVTIKGGTLELKSDILGSLTIPMAQVTSYSTAQTVALIRKDQEPVRGTLALLPSGDWQVTAKGQEQSFKLADVALIMPEDAYHKTYEGAAPKPWQAWKGTASLGEGLQRGNQKTNTFTTTVNAVRERPATLNFERHFRSTFGLAALLSHAEETGSNVTSHTLTTSLREDFLFSPRDFAFGMAQVDHISTEGLYLRQTFGGGFGVDVIKNPNTTFSLLGGLTYQHEHFNAAPTVDGINGLFGEVFSRQFSKRVRLDHNLTFYPDFSHGGEYRFDTTTAFSFKLSNRLSLNTSFIDLFLSNPPAGNKQNNVTFSTGVGLTF